MINLINNGGATLHLVGGTNAPKYTNSIKVKEKPFNNNFTQEKYIKTIKTSNGLDAYVVVVKCTDDSAEPGRLYACTYTTTGRMLDCYTLN